MRSGGRGGGGVLGGMVFSCQFLSEPRTGKGRRGKEGSGEGRRRRERKKIKGGGPDY